MRRYLIAMPIVLSTLLLAACATEKLRSRQTVLEETLRSYAATIRWGDIAQAQAFIDPKVREAHPVSALELARFKQVQVSGYNDQPVVPVGDNEVHQTVQIDLVNVNTQSARSVVDHQVWHYDEAAKRWWLTSGLPDISRQE
ncbi:MAG: hypothetical protein ACHP7D_01320 [Lysobacterales bacterium]